RLLTWLLQVSTAAGAGAVWAVLAIKLPPAESLVAEPASAAEDDDEPEPEPQVPVMGEPPPPPPPAPAVEAPKALEPEPVAVVPARSTLDEATAIYQDRLAYSPNRDRAKELLDRLSAAELSGRDDEARVLLAELSEL